VARARLALSYAVVGALIVVLVGVAGRGPLGFLKRSSTSSSASSGGSNATTPSTVAGETTTTIFLLEPRSYDRGECVIFDQTPDDNTHETHVVDCAQPHLMEMTASLQVSVAYDHFPSATEWKALFDHDCAPSIRALMGAPLDPVGVFYATGIQPAADSWADGDRTIWCGVGEQPLTAPPRPFEGVPFRGKVEGRPQARIYPIGACLTSDTAYVVPCSHARLVEVAGWVDLTGKVAQPPAPDDVNGWQRLVGDPCLRAARDYLGHDPVNDQGAGWNPIQPGSWATGRRVAECTVARYRGGQAIPSIGSLKS
jgi:hypothetical protein